MEKQCIQNNSQVSGLADWEVDAVSNQSREYTKNMPVEEDKNPLLFLEKPNHSLTIFLFVCRK